MHFPHPPLGDRFSYRQNSESGFSLVEITLAIGIIAFAFVALFGLLPTGLNTFRGAIDSSNETWIMQDISSMIQVTDWSKVRDLGSDKSDTIYYFDEQGKMTDWVSTSHAGSSDAKVTSERRYAVKLIIDNAERPRADGEKAEQLPGAYRVVLLFAPSFKPGVMATFDSIKTAEDLKKTDKGSEIHTRAIVVAQMDSSIASN